MKDIDPGETANYLHQVADFYEDPGNLGKAPPDAPSAAIAMDAAAAYAQSLALILDFQRNGHIASLEPTDESRLQAAQLIDRFTDRRAECGDVKAMHEMRDIVRRLFGEEGE